MTISDVEQLMEKWAPRWTAWDRDNVGMQVGNRDKKVSRMLVALELDQRVLSEAIRKKIDLIVTHHPLLFHPATSITSSDETGRLLLGLAKHEIALYCAHTNLDVAEEGVSYALAELLGLHNVKFLSPLQAKMDKIVVFVPASHADNVARAMASAGAGIIGNYEECSFRTIGTGTFKGGAESEPFLGSPGTLAAVEEIRLEMTAPSALLDSIVQALKRVHPYEEVAYDVYPLRNHSLNIGMGALGNLPRPIALRAFLRRVKKQLKCESLRYTGRLERQVRTIAVCGGSGTDLLETAVRARADVFVTADIRYHTFQSAQGRIALVDAGHWETEQGVLKPLAKKLQDETHQAGQRVTVSVSQYSTNPVHSL
jgi:dinuclear metal center YbgI/SA1388 family protein